MARIGMTTAADRLTKGLGWNIKSTSAKTLLRRYGVELIVENPRVLLVEEEAIDALIASGKVRPPGRPKKRDVV